MNPSRNRLKFNTWWMFITCWVQFRSLDNINAISWTYIQYLMNVRRRPYIQYLMRVRRRTYIQYLLNVQYLTNLAPFQMEMTVFLFFNVLGKRRSDWRWRNRRAGCGRPTPRPGRPAATPWRGCARRWTPPAPATIPSAGSSRRSPPPATPVSASTNCSSSSVRLG